MNRDLQTKTDSHEIIAVSHQFSGPIPPPEAMAKYESVLPGAAERILKMAENEAASRQRNDEKVVNNIVRTSYLGIYFAFASVILLTALACLALVNDHPTVATGCIVAMASVAGIFILFRNRKVKSSENNQK